VKDQIGAGVFDLSSLDSENGLMENLILNDIPESILNADHTDYEEFLITRRKLMAQRIKNYYENL
jgi:hypothetical protein